MMKDSSLGKLIRLCSTISDTESLISEFQQEIETKESSPPLTSMIKSLLKSTNITNLGFNLEILSIFFEPKTITEFDLHSGPKLGIKCFFMSEGTIFPIHDHPNKIVVTAVLYGKIKYLSINKTEDPTIMTIAKKATGKVGSLMFTTINYRNAHTILALENTVIIDIFMHEVKEQGFYYKVLKKTGKKLEVVVDEHVFFLTRSFKALDCECHHL